MAIRFDLPGIEAILLLKEFSMSYFSAFGVFRS